MANTLTDTTLYAKQGASQISLAPATTALQTYMAAEDGTDSNVSAEIIALRQRVADLVNDGVIFKGVLDANHALPTVSYKAGWEYYVAEAGTYAGHVCEIGDLLLCIKDYASGSASNADWAAIQVNITGAVTGPASAVANHVASFDGTSGNINKDSGFTIAKSVPANAEFTDTTYNDATQSAAGLMSANDKKKLDGIEAGADVTDASSVAAAGAFMLTDNSDSITQGTTHLFMTDAERTKLSGIAAGAEVNQNAYTQIAVGSTTLVANSKTDKLTLEAGSGITLTPTSSTSANGDKVNIAETYIDSCVVTNLSNVPSNLRDGGLIILKS